MAITAADVKRLRQATGLGMMDCQKALRETDGDFEKAAELIRTKYKVKMADRADRENAEGKVAVAVSPDGTKAALVEVNTETDFTANNDAFLAMIKLVADQALAGNPGEVTKTDAMEAAIEEIRLTTRENAQFGRGVVLAASRIGSYVHHTGKVGVVIAVEGEASDELLRDLCMHISAISPAALGVNEEDIPADVIEKERVFAKQEALDSGKPEEIAEKMVDGKIRKFYDSVVLLRQPFVKDDKKQIKDLLPAGTTIQSFVKYAIG